MGRARKPTVFSLLNLILILIITLTGAAPQARAGEPDRGAGSPMGQGAPAGIIRRAGAYFFFWYTYPNQAGLVPVQQYLAFHPPGVSETDELFHLPPYEIPYEGGTYNTVYYNSVPSETSADAQRWWEWQFRDMVEAGLDFAVLVSWDGSDSFSAATHIEDVAPYINGALDALGNPLQIAIYDDTYSEMYAWNVDTYGQLPPAECRPPTASGCEQYRMPLSDEANWQYFIDKIDTFYSAVHRDKWATLDGRPVDQGGRPLILMHQGEGFFRDFVAGGTRHAARLLCTIKKYMIEHFSTPNPFLLPNGTWGLWGGDPGLVEPTLCSAVGISVPGDPYALDGWSEYGTAGGGPYVPNGAIVHTYGGSESHTTAYLGPGCDVYSIDYPVAYSGPYGGAGPDYWPFYNARWWTVEQEPLPWGSYCLDGRCQDRYYFQSWSYVATHQPAPELAVIESWNEIAEGTEIGKITTYVGPDLTCGQGPPCEELAFTENPYHESPWSPWFWIFRSRDIIRQWKGLPPGSEIIVDDPSDAPGWDRDTGNLGQWFYEDWFHYARDDAPPASLSWAPTLPQGGYYDVYAYWPYVQGATEDAHYYIHHAAGTALVRMDQSRFWDAGGWSFLGRYPFRGGSNPEQGVELTNQVTNPRGEHVLADAVKLVYYGPWTPPIQRVHLPYLAKAAHSAAGAPVPPAPPDSYPPITPSPSPSPPPSPPPYPGPTPTPPPMPTPTPTPAPPDHTPPQSQVTSLPPFCNQPGFWVTWTAEDAGGSGVARIHVQACDGAEPWQDWLPYAGTFAYYSPALDGHTYSFRSQATDWAGNVEPWPGQADAFTTVDLVSPTSRVNDLPPYSPSSFAVSWSGQDSVSGIASYDVQYCLDDCSRPASAWTDWLIGTPQTSATFSGDQDGHTYCFRSRAHDYAGNTEVWPRLPDASTQLDALPPTSAVDGLPEFSHSPFTVTWSGQDSVSGIASYDVQVYLTEPTLPEQAVWKDWITGTTATEAVYSGTDALVYFRSRARDRAGNEEMYPVTADASTIIDSTPPSSQVDDLPSYSRPAFTVSWTGQDSLSGIASYDVQVSTRPYKDPSIGSDAVWTGWLSATTATTAQFTGGENGQVYSFRCRARDRVGNIEPWPDQADAGTAVDALPPTSEVDDLPTFSTAAFTVSWRGQDIMSGIANYDVQISTRPYTDPNIGSDAVWTDWLSATTATTAQFTGGENGQVYSFRCRARDRVGNIEPWPDQADAGTAVDTLPPVSQVGSLPAYSPATFTVTWSGEDDLSGLSSFDMQLCPGECVNPDAPWTGWLTETSALSATFTEGEDGQTYSFRCRTRDQVGNVEQWPGEPDAFTRVDTSPPASQVDPLPSFSRATFTVTWSGLDLGSGIAGYDVQFCQQPGPDCWQDWLTGTLATAAPFSGTHGQFLAFRCRARDALGNQEGYPPEADAITQVDAEAPQTHMDPPFPLSYLGLFEMRWHGQDEPAGLASYDLYVRDESAEAWMPWLQGVTTTQAVFAGTAGHTYHFCVRGMDRAGNLEAKDCPGAPGAWPITSEVIVAVPPTSRVDPLPPTAPSNPFRVSWQVAPEGMGVQVQVMDVAAGTWRDWVPGTGMNSAWFLGEPGHTYAFRCRAVNTSGQPLEPWPWGDDTHTNVPNPVTAKTSSQEAGRTPTRASRQIGTAATAICRDRWRAL